MMISKIMLEAKIEGRQCRGRPRNNFIKQLQKKVKKNSGDWFTDKSIVLK